MRRILRNLVLFPMLALAICVPALADANVEEDVQNWRLQNYVSNTVSAYFTGSSCTYGMLTFPSTASADDKNRFWALVLTAKTTGKKVGVFYETTSGTCQITSYYTPT
jgi:hypothetical protein